MEEYVAHETTRRSAPDEADEEADSETPPSETAKDSKKRLSRESSIVSLSSRIRETPPSQETALEKRIQSYLDKKDNVSTGSSVPVSDPKNELLLSYMKHLENMIKHTVSEEYWHDLFFEISKDVHDFAGKSKVSFGSHQLPSYGGVDHDFIDLTEKEQQSKGKSVPGKSGLVKKGAKKSNVPVAVACSGQTKVTTKSVTVTKNMSSVKLSETGINYSPKKTVNVKYRTVSHNSSRSSSTSNDEELLVEHMSVSEKEKETCVETNAPVKKLDISKYFKKSASENVVEAEVIDLSKESKETKGSSVEHEIVVPTACQIHEHVTQLSNIDDIQHNAPVIVDEARVIDFSEMHAIDLTQMAQMSQTEKAESQMSQSQMSQSLLGDFKQIGTVAGNISNTAAVTQGGNVSITSCANMSDTSLSVENVSPNYTIVDKDMRLKPIVVKTTTGFCPLHGFQIRDYNVEFKYNVQQTCEKVYDCTEELGTESDQKLCTYTMRNVFLCDQQHICTTPFMHATLVVIPAHLHNTGYQTALDIDKPGFEQVFVNTDGQFNYIEFTPKDKDLQLQTITLYTDKDRPEGMPENI